MPRGPAALAVLDGKAASAFALTFLGQKNRPVQIKAVQVLGTRPEAARLAGRLFLAGKLPRELLPYVSEALRAIPARMPKRRSC